MEFRKADTGDIRSISDIWEEFVGEHDGIVTACNSQLRKMNLRNDNAQSLYEKYLLGYIESGNGVAIIAEENGSIVGYSFGFIKDEIPIFQLKRYGYFSDLYVKKACRGRGISSRLKDKMILWFKRNGAEYVAIGFYADNIKAREIYKKWGFFDYKIEARKKI